MRVRNKETGEIRNTKKLARKQMMEKHRLTSMRQWKKFLQVPANRQSYMSLVASIDSMLRRTINGR